MTADRASDTRAGLRARKVIFSFSNKIPSHLNRSLPGIPSRSRTRWQSGYLTP